jgi:Ca-activated chloride channel homolog
MRRIKLALLSTAIALGLAVSFVVQARAQQGESSNQQIPTPQRQGGGSVLELPKTPASQGGESASIPPLTPQPGQELEIPPRQLRSQLGYAQVTVTVTDASGGYITGLNKEDFKLSVDGRQRPIEFFRRDERAPVSVGILVDTSGSMQPKIPQARAAIAQFLRDLNPRDDVFLMAFSGRPFLLQSFTTDHSLVMGRLGLLHAFGNTALYDVIVEGLQMVQRGRYDKKALLVVTDGMDTASRMYSLQDAIAEARRKGVLVYSIGIGDPNASGLSVDLFGFVIGGGDIERVDANTLQKLSGETGAKTFIIRQVGDGQALRRACEQISLELREQYTLGFLASDPERGGYRSVHVDVPTRPDAMVRVRKGITVGPGGAPAMAGSP